MAQYKDGRCSVDTGSQQVFGVYEVTVTGVTGTYATDDFLAFSNSGATGAVEAWSPGNSTMRLTVDSTSQPQIGDVVTSTAATGTLSRWSFQPNFLEKVSVGDIFRVNASGEPFYSVGGVDTRAMLSLTANYAGLSKSDVNYIVSTSFTQGYNIPYPEPGDLSPTSVLKQAILTIDNLLLAVSGSLGAF